VLALRYCYSSHIDVDTHREAVNGEFVEEPLLVQTGYEVEEVSSW